MWHCSISGIGQAHRRVEGGQRRLSGIGQAHLDESHVIASDPDRVQQRPVAGDHAVLFQPFHPRLGRGFRQSDARDQIGDADPAIGRYPVENRVVEAIKLRQGRLHRFTA